MIRMDPVFCASIFGLSYTADKGPLVLGVLTATDLFFLSGLSKEIRYEVRSADRAALQSRRAQVFIYNFLNHGQPQDLRQAVCAEILEDPGIVDIFTTKRYPHGIIGIMLVKIFGAS